MFCRLKIIDDNIDVLISQEIEQDIAAENEDAPQIVAVIDERPLPLQIDEKTNTCLWIPIGQASTTETEIQSFKLNKQLKNTDVQKSALRVTKKSINYDKRNKSLLMNEDNYSARSEREKSNSPLRKNESNYNLSPARRNFNSDSPPKKKGKDYNDSKKSFRENYSDDYNDYSSPRRKNRERSTSPKQTKSDISSLSKKKYEDDNSPPRKRNTDDSSPPRRKNIDSPPRRNKKDDISPRRRKSNGDNSPPRRNKEYDNSPPRRNKKNDSTSPRRRDKEDGSSPPRKRSKDYNNSPPKRGQKSDNSPPRQRKNDYSKETRVNEEDHSPQRKRYKENSLSPKQKNKDDRKIKTYREGKKSRWNVEDSPESSSSEKLRKTLDGKRAGLQSAEDLFKESKHLRQKEDEIFKKMSAEVSGRDAATVVRGKKIKDFEEEAAREKREKEMKEKYDRWGKGLKQVEDQNKRFADQLHEMNKPLARYADDEDLEKFLKEQEREGDPMLAYIRKKKKKEKVAAGISGKESSIGYMQISFLLL